MASCSLGGLGGHVVVKGRGKGRGLRGGMLASSSVRGDSRKKKAIERLVYSRGERVRACARIVRRREGAHVQDKVGESANEMNALANACVRAMLHEDNDAVIDLQMKLDEMHQDAGGDGLLARALSSLLSNRVPDDDVLSALPPAHDAALRMVYSLVEDSGWNIEEVNAHAGQARPNVSDLSDELFQPPPAML